MREIQKSVVTVFRSEKENKSFGIQKPQSNYRTKYGTRVRVKLGNIDRSIIHRFTCQSVWSVFTTFTLYFITLTSLRWIQWIATRYFFECNCSLFRHEALKVSKPAFFKECRDQVSLPSVSFWSGHFKLAVPTLRRVDKTKGTSCLA